TAEAQLRCDIVEVGRRLYARGLIGGHEGNVSVRLDASLLITPAGVCKGFLTPEMIVRTDLEGRPQDGGQASTETLMHTAVYRRRGDVHAVVHAHPPTATAFAVAGIALDRPLIAEAVVTLGAVPVIPYGQPSTHELADNAGGGPGPRGRPGHAERGGAGPPDHGGGRALPLLTPMDPGHAVRLVTPQAVLRPWAAEDAEAVVPQANDRRVWLNLRDAFPHPY